MRIAILSPFYPYRGGIAQFSASLYRELEKEHHVKAFTFTRQYPSILFPGKTQYVSDDDVADKIEAHRVLDSINPLSYFKTIKAIDAFDPEVVILRYWMPFFGPSLGFIARRIKSPVISIVDNAVPHERRFFDVPFSKYFLSATDGLIAMSDSVKNDIHALMPQHPPIEVLPHPVYNHFGVKLEKDQARRNLDIDSRQKLLLFFGIIRDYKGLDLLIEAFSSLDSTYSLIIAGESYGSFDGYQKSIDRNPNRERIHLYNRYIPDHEVAQFFSAADVCILPYRSATQSGITAIALHFDLPIIATDTGGLRQSIAEVGMGEVIEDFEPDSLVEAIRKYFKENKIDEYRLNISKHKEENSWSRFAENTMRLAEKLLRTAR
ncbi:MAG: glycosyltransferase [Cryomorphaceae bacterium]|nr:glycosyltransferase [Cryomorphaceae bacterium]